MTAFRVEQLPKFIHLGKIQTKQNKKNLTDPNIESFARSTCRSEIAIEVSNTVQMTASLQRGVVNEPLYR